MVAGCACNPGLHNLPALRLAGSSGEPYPAGLVAAMRQRLPNTRLIDSYGLAETHFAATMLLDEQFSEHMGSVGRPLPCLEVQVRNGSGAVLGRGEPGEIWLRGSPVTTGYLDGEAATREPLVNGWLRTHDLGRVSRDGYLYVLGRVTDTITVGGNRVFPASVEALLRQLPQVNDAVVLAAPDRSGNEVLVAFVVRQRAAGSPSPTYEGAYASGWPTTRSPRSSGFVPQVPRHPTGKADKPALRRLLVTPG